MSNRPYFPGSPHESICEITAEEYEKGMLQRLEVVQKAYDQVRDEVFNYYITKNDFKMTYWRRGSTTMCVREEPIKKNPNGSIFRPGDYDL